jgi:hypothetical protein
MPGAGIERSSNVAAVDETFKKAPESKKKTWAAEGVWAVSGGALWHVR